MREKMIERGAHGATNACLCGFAPCETCRRLATAVIDAIGAEEMAEALEPFVALLTGMEHRREDGTLYPYSGESIYGGFRGDGMPTVGDLRRARAALVKATGGEDSE